MACQPETQIVIALTFPITPYQPHTPIIYTSTPFLHALSPRFVSTAVKYQTLHRSYTAPSLLTIIVPLSFHTGLAIVLSLS